MCVGHVDNRVAKHLSIEKLVASHLLSLYRQVLVHKVTALGVPKLLLVLPMFSCCYTVLRRIFQGGPLVNHSNDQTAVPRARVSHTQCR